MNVAFKGVNLFDGEHFHPDQSVVVADARIESVGPAGESLIPDGTAGIDGYGKTLLPGFIDAHVHLGLMDPAKVLRGGVTMARDLGWPLGAVTSLRDHLSENPTSGPALKITGPMITAPGGYPSKDSWAPYGTAMQVESVQGARAAVHELTAAGVDIIKVAQEPRGGPTLSLETLSAVVEAAHESNRKVTSHVGSLEQLEIALEAGVDELAHGLWSDEKIPADIIERMVAQQVAMIPTLHIDPSPMRLENTRRFVQAGGNLVYGTDMGNTGPPAGIDPYELELMIQAGLSIKEALSAATSSAATHLGSTERGRIVAGAVADLILADVEVVRDPRDLKNPLVVLREGVRI